jgi:hypothetical protein
MESVYQCEQEYEQYKGNENKGGKVREINQGGSQDQSYSCGARTDLSL